MRIKTQIFIGFFLIYVMGFYFFFDVIINDIRPRYLEAVEESLNDTANMLAAFLETEYKNGKIQTKKLDKTFKKVVKRQLQSKIYSVVKKSINLRLYVTNKKGIVIYHSLGKDIGKDYSNWNDVYLTLKGKYGARSSLENPQNPGSSALYISAPIKVNNKIVGVVTVIKPKDRITLFIELAKQKVIIAGILSAGAILILSVLLSIIVTRPIMQLIQYVKKIKSQERTKLPKLRSKEIKDLGSAFEEMRLELEGKKYIENYIQTLTHEIKSPLTSIKGAALLLTEKMSNEDRDKFYMNIINESERIQNIIDRLLDLSSIENRSGLKDVEKICVQEVVKELILSYKPQTDQYELIIESSFCENAIIEGELFLFRHAVSNIIQNAIQFARSKVSINVLQKNETISLEVLDDGEGIPDYAIDNIFNKFYSLPSRIKNRKSSGLGLSFVKETMVLHGGNIMVNSSETGVKVTLDFLKKL